MKKTSINWIFGEDTLGIQKLYLSYVKKLPPEEKGNMGHFVTIFTSLMSSDFQSNPTRFQKKVSPRPSRNLEFKGDIF
jgi:hypothetical protein